MVPLAPTLPLAPTADPEGGRLVAPSGPGGSDIAPLFVLFLSTDDSALVPGFGGRKSP